MDHEVIVETRNFYPNMASIFNSEEKLREIIHNNWAVEIFWFPFSSLPFDLSNDELWVRTFNKISPEAIEKVEDVEFYETQDVYDFITQEALRIVSPFITANEPIVPLMQWLSFLTLKMYCIQTEWNRYIKKSQTPFILGDFTLTNQACVIKIIANTAFLM